MREVYITTALVLRSRAHGEDSVEALLFTEALGKVRVLAQAGKRPGATFAAPTQVGTFGRYTLIRGRNSWRMRGAHELQQYSLTLRVPAREAYLRTLALLARFLPEQEAHPKLFAECLAYIDTLVTLGASERSEAECALSILKALGYADATARETTDDTRALIREVNQGISAAQL